MTITHTLLSAVLDRTCEALAVLEVHCLHAHGKVQLPDVPCEALAVLEVHGLHAYGKVQLPDVPCEKSIERRGKTW